MSRRGKRGKGKKKRRKKAQAEQESLRTDQRNPDLEAGRAFDPKDLPPDAVPPNSFLLGEEDESEGLGYDEFGNPHTRHTQPPPDDAAPQQAAPQKDKTPDPFAHFPRPKIDETPLADTEDAEFTAFEPPPVHDMGRETQHRLTWVADNLSIGSKRDARGIVPEVKLHAALALVTYSTMAPDPNQPGMKEPVMQIQYMTDGIWITIPWVALPIEHRKNPNKLSIERAVQIFTGFFRTFPCEVIRPKPKPRELERIPDFIKEAVSRGAMANAMQKEE